MGKRESDSRKKSEDSPSRKPASNKVLGVAAGKKGLLQKQHAETKKGSSNTKKTTTQTGKRKLEAQKPEKKTNELKKAVETKKKKSEVQKKTNDLKKKTVEAQKKTQTKTKAAEQKKPELPKKSAEVRKKPVELPKKTAEVPKKTVESAKKTVETSNKSKKTNESSGKTAETPKKAAELSKKTPEPEKTTVASKKTAELPKKNGGASVKTAELPKKNAELFGKSVAVSTETHQVQNDNAEGKSKPENQKNSAESARPTLIIENAENTVSDTALKKPKPASEISPIAPEIGNKEMIDSGAQPVEANGSAEGKISTASIVHESAIAGEPEEAIETSLADLTTAEREKYSWGKALKTGENKPYNDYDKLALEFYERLHEALRSAGNDAELLQWEKLIEHNLKPRQVEQKKDESDEVPSKIILKSNDKDGVINLIIGMTPVEQAKYRDDLQYREKLEKSVDSILSSSPYREAAHHMLSVIKSGGTPSEDLVVRTYKSAAATVVNEEAVLADLQQALNGDPSLKNKLLSPSNPADQLFRQNLQKALRTALSEDVFNQHVASTFVAPVIPNTTESTVGSTGEVAPTAQTEAQKSAFTDNKEALLLSLASAPAYERSLLLDQNKKNASAIKIQQQMLSPLTPEQRQVGELLLRQRTVKTEDKMRIMLIGAGGNLDELKETLTHASSDERAQVAREYERKYGHPITMDLACLSAQNQSEFQLLFTAGAQESRSEPIQGRDNEKDKSGLLGRSLVDSGWDGTGMQLDEAVGRYARTMAKSAQRFNDLTAEQRNNFAEQLGRTIELYRSSKNAVAENGVDALLAAGAVAAAPYTGGVSLAYLIAAAGLTGATLNVVARAAMEGEKYDWSSISLGKDIATGFVKGAANMLGPAEVARMLKLGNVVASKCATETLKKAVASGMEKVLAPGAEKALDKAMKTMILNAVSAGADKIEKKALMQLAQKVISKELAVQARQTASENLAALIESTLDSEFKTACKTNVGKVFREISLNTGSGALAGIATGAADASMKTDSRKNIGENLADVGGALVKGASLSAGLAAGLSVSRNLVKGVINNMRQGAASEPTVQPDDRSSPE